MRPEATETLLRSTVRIRKGVIYELFESWLGTGMLTSHGKKWKHRRRILTPAFHKTVLTDFAEVMNEKSKVLVKILSYEAKKNSGLVNIYEIGMKLTRKSCI